MTKLLIVEDEPRLCRYLGRLCESEKMQVLTCATGSEAVKIDDTQLPDILITDWLLKDELDGVLLSRELRRRNPKMRTIVISGLPLEDIKEQAASDEIFAFVSKPFEFSELEKLVKAASVE